MVSLILLTVTVQSHNNDTPVYYAQRCSCYAYNWGVTNCYQILDTVSEIFWNVEI